MKLSTSAVCCMYVHTSVFSKYVCMLYVCVHVAIETHSANLPCGGGFLLAGRDQLGQAASELVDPFASPALN